MMGIHWFSFIIVLLTPFAIFVNNKISIPLAVVFTIIVFYSSSFLSTLELISVGLFDGGTSNRIANYLYYNENESVASNNLFGLLRILLMSFVLPILTIRYNKTNNELLIFNKLLALVLVFGALQMKMVIFGRFLNYLNIILIVCFVAVLYHKKHMDSLIKIVFSSLVALYLMFGCISFYKPSYLERRSWVHYNCSYIPYKTIFQEPDPMRESLQ